MFLSTILRHPCSNPILPSFFNVKLFCIEYSTNKRHRDYSTKVVSEITLSAVIPTDSPDSVFGFQLEVTASATRVARHKMFNCKVCSSLSLEQINDISKLSTIDERRNAIADLVLNQMAKMQLSLVQSEVNSPKNYSKLFNNKVFQQWYYASTKPLSPFSEGLHDETGLIDATYQATTCGYIEVVTYLVEIIETQRNLTESK